MPTSPAEPPATGWLFADPATAADDDLVSMGADLEPGTILAAYRRGLFPMPMGHRDEPMLWWSPQRRGVLPLDAMRVSRSLRASARRLEIRVDTAFPEVITACADPARDSGWIDARIIDAYSRLHDLGWVHSVETWQDDRLVGGLYGVAVGGLFAGESMFYRVRDASKVALLSLVEMMRDEYADRRLLDVQWRTPHLGSLGVVEVARPTYTRLLRDALTLPLPSAFR